MLSIEKYLENDCKVDPNEKIDTSTDGYWKLKDLIQAYIDEAGLVKNNGVLADVSICVCGTEKYAESTDRSDGYRYCGKCNKPY